MPHPARLFCLLSRNYQKVAIYRRGPHKRTQLILWNLESDEFNEGQWLHGSVYPERCAISPSGKYVATTIAKHSLQTDDASTFYSWTSISKPPYFTSLHTFLKKTSQASGGYFAADNHFIYNGNKNDITGKGINRSKKMDITFRFKDNKLVIFGEHPLNDSRLTDLGWETAQKFKGDYRSTIEPQIEIKKLNEKFAIILELSRTADFKIKSKYSIQRKNEITIIEDAQWMDFDYRGRIMLARYGKIFIEDTFTMEQSKFEFRELKDFNDSVPKQMKPPDDYYQW